MKTKLLFTLFLSIFSNCLYGSSTDTPSDQLQEPGTQTKFSTSYPTCSGDENDKTLLPKWSDYDPIQKLSGKSSPKATSNTPKKKK